MHATPIFGDAFLQWNDILGRSFEAKIVSAGTREVRLENREGKQINFPVADLKPSSKAQLVAWQTKQGGKTGSETGAVATGAAPESVFDDVLSGDLVRLDGKRLKRDRTATRPEKYYLFYYTASWCPPCQKFTPQLVEWYKTNKNKNFEVVLISSDRSEEAMEAYAADKQMPWPQLEMGETERFKERFDHGVTGIPSLILCELDGTMLGNYRARLNQLTDLVE